MERVYNNYTGIKNAIIGTLTRYMVYRMPLKADDIFSHLPVACRFSQLLVALEDLEAARMVFQDGGFYSLDPEIRKLVICRKIASN